MFKPAKATFLCWWRFLTDRVNLVVNLSMLMDCTSVNYYSKRRPCLFQVDVCPRYDPTENEEQFNSALKI